MPLGWQLYCFPMTHPHSCGIRNALVTTATDMTIDGGVGWDRYTGYGMINAYQALLTLSPGNPLPDHCSNRWISA
jgi:hypothetical protein